MGRPARCTRRVRMAGACTVVAASMGLGAGTPAEAATPPAGVVGEITELRTAESRTYITDRGTMLRSVSPAGTSRAALLAAPGGAVDCEIVNGSQANTSACAKTTNRVGAAGGTVQRTIMRFDALPEGAIVLDATLKLWDVGGSANRVSIALHRLTRPFGDGVTWNRASTAVAWTQPGGDIGPSEGVSSAPTSQATSGEWVSWKLPVLAQSWIDGRTPPGFALKQANESTSGSRTFAAAEGLDSTRAPQLLIEYVPRSGDALHYTFEDIPLDDGRIRINLGTGYASVEAPGALDFGPPGAPLTPIHHPALGTTGEFGVGTSFSLGANTFARPRGNRQIELATPDGGRWLVLDTPAGGGTNTNMPYGVDGDLRSISDGTYNLSSETYEANLTFAPNPDGRLRSWGEFNGSSWAPTYTAEGLQRITYGDGHVISVAARSGGRITRIETEEDDRTFLYDATGRLTGVERAGERLLTLDRSTRGVPFEDLTATTAGGRTVTLEFDAAGRVLRVQDSDPDRTDLAFAYEPGIVRVTRDGQVTEHRHTATGQVYSPDATAPTIDAADGSEEGSTAAEAGDGAYVDGIGIESVSLAALDAASGVAGVELRRGGIAIAARQGSCGVAATGHASVCTPKLTLTTQFDATAWAEGQTAHELSAVDAAGNRRTEPFGVYVDRTAPGGPSAIAITGFDPTTGTMEVGFEEAEDPDLPGSIPGSGVSSTRIRHRINGGAWSNWGFTTDNDYPVTGVSAGQVVQLELQSSDAVGNQGTAVAASLVVGPPPPAPEDEDISGPGSAQLRVVLEGAPGTIAEGEPLSDVSIVVTSATERISNRTDAEGVALFPGLPPGEYVVDRDGPRPRTVTLAAGETRTVELNGDAVSTLIEEPTEARRWCKKIDVDQPKRLRFCAAWASDGELAIRAANRLFNVNTLFDADGNVIISNDGTSANAFQHMFWNALVIDTIDDADWIFGFEEGHWRDEAAYLIDNRYEAESRRGSLRDRRRSRMDVHNNRHGRAWMRARVDRDLNNEVICSGIRRRVTTVIRARFKGRRSDQFVNVLNLSRPLYIQRKGWVGPDTPAVRSRLIPSDEFESGNPCDPLTNSRR
jgi:YD repeat-containing protein